MIYALPDRPLMEDGAASQSSLEQERITSLARTYDTVLQPVWVHDLSARCVYRNRAASRTPARDDRVMVFEIVDESDRTIGHLKTMPT